MAPSFPAVDFSCGHFPLYPVKHERIADLFDAQECRESLHAAAERCVYEVEELETGAHFSIWRNGSVRRCIVHGGSLSAVLLADNSKGGREKDNLRRGVGDPDGSALCYSVRLAV